MSREFPAPKYSTPDLTRYFIVKFNKSMNLDQVVNAFSKISFIETIDKVGVHKLYGEPNDVKYPQQWHLNQANDHDIDAPEAWNIQTGSENVILAIIDSGVSYNHLDLNDNIWINAAEYNGNPGEDDDEPPNGYVDDIRGWNWFDDNNNPDDIYGHGTHIAGIAAAETNNNSIGVAGIAGGWNGQGGCRIMCLKIYKNGPCFMMHNAAQAIHYATDKGATAINYSLESNESADLREAVNYATTHGVLIVVAAGNDNIDPCNDKDKNYLCTLTLPGILVVAATDKRDDRADNSNHGPCVDVAAPGKEILSTIRTGGYGLMSGTSMSAPMVVGLAGLIKSQKSDWNRSKIWDAIVKSVDYIGGPELGLGSGRINAYYALKQTWLPAAPTILNATAVSVTKINLGWKDNSDNEINFVIQRKKAGGTFSTIKILGRNITSYSDRSVSDGTYYYRVRASNVNGNSSFSNTKCVTTFPKAPTNLNAKAISSSEIKITWRDNSKVEQGFQIQRKDADSSWKWKTVHTITNPNPTPTKSWTESGLKSNRTYCYRVRAYNSSGNSNWSNQDCDKTPLGPPESPSNLRATAPECFEIQLTWKDNSDIEQGFKIYRKSGPNWYQIATVAHNITKFWDTELPCSQTFSYKVRAYNHAGNSSYSNIASAKTISCYYCNEGLSLKIIPDKKVVSSGELVTYTYKVKNKGEKDLKNIKIKDEKFGDISIEFTLEKNKSKTFTKTATLTETYTNFAEATAIYKDKNKVKRVKAHACATVEVKK